MPHQSKNILYGCLSILLVLGSLWVVWKMTSSPSSQNKEEAAKNITITADDTIKGNTEAPITLVEYSDFQCPACKLYSTTVKSVIEANPDVRLVYRHFPLDQHQNARKAAAAAEAAGKQKKFFEFHDMLFETQDQWGTSKDAEKKFVEFAQKLKLNIDTFKKDMTSKEVLDDVESDYQTGIQFGVDSTPSFYLDGVRIKPNSAAEFQTLIESARAKNNPEKSGSGSAQVTGSPTITKNK